MRLTQFTDYSLRVLIFAALRDPELASIPEIAAAYDIRQNHLTKVVHTLGKGRYLETVRGRGGGLRLGKPTAEINIGELVRYTESDFRIVECFPPSSGACRLEPACVLAPVLEQAFEAFTAVLDGYTLADLVKPRQALAELLSIQPS